MDKFKRKKTLIFLGISIGLIVLSPIAFGLMLNDLEDVNINTPVSCNFLHYNGSVWSNYDLWNTSPVWYFNHTFINNVTANYFIGNGSLLTGISGGGGVSDGYAGDMGHPHNQDLNTTSTPTFNNITLNQVPTWFYMFTHNNWNNLTNIPLDFSDNIDNDILGYNNIFNQNLNTSNNVEFQDLLCGDITNNELNQWVFDARNYDYLFNNQLGTPLILHSTGETSKRLESSCRARKSVFQNVMGWGWTKLVLPVEDYDQNNDYDTLFTRFTVPVQGLYQISYSVYMLEVANTNILMSAIFVNGVQRGGFEISHASTFSGTDLAHSGSDILFLNVNDRIELYVYHNAVGFKNFPAVTYSNYLAICKIA